MEYTIKNLAALARVSTRTLRYYDEIGILKPLRINSSGYRIYGEKSVDKLQQIMFYRELGVGLEQIKEIISSPSFDETVALKKHLKELQDKQMQIEILINNVKNTILSKEGNVKMSNKEKFEGFKKNLIEENENNYGKEIREKYGEEAVSKSNKMFKNMTEEQYKDLENLSNEVLSTLKEAIKTNDPSSELAQKTAELHKQWITFCWGDYNSEAHANLTQMYVDDERFKVYYDKVDPRGAEFLRDLVFIYTGMNKK